ncbi:hypothetical protein D3C86_1802690 [compost metagenome]
MPSHPAAGGEPVAVAGIDPAGAGVGVFALPERRLGFQEIHDERTGLECSLAVLAGDADKYDGFANGQ